MKIYSAILTVIALTPVPVQAKDKPPTNRISMEKARKIALRAYPGKIKGEELEFEGGKWIYSFDLRKVNDISEHEVNVDAISGKVLNVHIEMPAEETKELQDEKSKSEVK